MGVAFSCFDATLHNLIAPHDDRGRDVARGEVCGILGAGEGNGQEDEALHYDDGLAIDQATRRRRRSTWLGSDRPDNKRG